MTKMKIKQHRLSSSFSSVLVIPAAFASFLFSPTAQAQNQTTPVGENWQKIHAADARIKSVHAVWKRVMVFPPHPELDVEMLVQRASAVAKANGESVGEIKEIEDITRQSAQEDVRGHTHTSTLDFARIGSTIKCDVYTASPEDPRASQSIDFFDGENAVYVPIKSRGQETSRTGILTRDPMEILGRSAFNWLLPKFLVGVPFDEQTSPLNPAFNVSDLAVDVEKGEAVLERNAALDPQAPEGSDPDIHRVVFSTKDYRPHKYELLNVKRSIVGSVSIDSYQNLPGGVTFPSKVVVSTPVFTSTYTLIEAKFNQEVDPALTLLPAGIRLSDTRFGALEGITYDVKDGKVPSDTEVQKLLGDKEQKQVALKKVQEKTEVRPFRFAEFPMLGMMLTLCGAIMWVRTSKTE